MKYTIEVSRDNIGNDRRGYHNYNTFVRFIYTGDSYYVEKREREIAQEIVGHGIQMWNTLTALGNHAYKINHGYDSGD